MKIVSEALTKMTDDASPPLHLCRDYDDAVGATRRRRPHPLPGIDQTSKLGGGASSRTPTLISRVPIDRGAAPFTAYAFCANF